MTESTTTPPAISHLHYVGMVASGWAMIEFLVDSTAWRLAGLDPAVGACITGQMTSVHQKLKAVEGLSRHLGVSAKLMGELGKLARALYSTGEKRNRAVHDPWVTAITPQPGDHMAQVRVSPKGQGNPTKIVSTAELSATNAEIMMRQGELLKLADKIFAELNLSASGG